MKKEIMKDIDERLNVLEKQIDIVMSMVNHLNEVMTNKTIEKIELDFQRAVDQQIEELKKKTNE